MSYFSADTQRLKNYKREVSTTSLLPTDTGQLTDRLKSFAGQNKYLQD